MAGNHLMTGKQGEEIAVKYLRKKRYRILGRNVKAGGVEVDIVAQDGEIVVFIEVKTKSRDDAITPSARVDALKMARLKRAARGWVEGKLENGLEEVAARIDVVGVCGGRVVEHFEDVTA